MSSPVHFADNLHALAAPEALILRRAYKIGLGGARITAAEAEAIYGQMDDQGAHLIRELRARTQKRYDDAAIAKADKKKAKVK
jgi:hypothetical protein